MKDQEANLLAILNGTFRPEEDIRIYYSPNSAISLEPYPNILLFFFTSLWYDAQDVNEFVTKFNQTDFNEDDILAAVLTIDSSYKQLLTESIEKEARDLKPVVLQLLAARKPEIF